MFCLGHQCTYCTCLSVFWGHRTNPRRLHLSCSRNTRNGVGNAQQADTAIKSVAADSMWALFVSCVAHCLGDDNVSSVFEAEPISRGVFAHGFDVGPMLQGRPNWTDYPPGWLSLFPTLSSQKLYDFTPALDGSSVLPCKTSLVWFLDRHRRERTRLTPQRLVGRGT